MPAQRRRPDVGDQFLKPRFLPHSSSSLLILTIFFFLYLTVSDWRALAAAAVSTVRVRLSRAVKPLFTLFN